MAKRAVSGNHTAYVALHGNSFHALILICMAQCSAQWLRNTANQLAVYQSVLPQDPQLASLVKAVINNEARYISQYLYCGAFQPPPESGLAPSHNDYADLVTVNPCVFSYTSCVQTTGSRCYTETCG